MAHLVVPEGHACSQIIFSQCENKTNLAFFNCDVFSFDKSIHALVSRLPVDIKHIANFFLNFMVLVP